MAITIKKAAKVSVSDMLAQFQKDKGETVGNFGGKLLQSARIPTGLFPLDLALGGGFPRGRCSIIYGPESSNKTNIALRAIAMHQMLWPQQVCVYFDLENEFNPEWAALLGVDTKKLVVISPTYAEQVVDMVEGFLYSEDCGIVVIDSLAALVTTNEAESSAEKAVVGGAASPIGKLYRKTVMALAEAEKHGRHPSLFYINQITYKIGVMFGDPETMPGGKKPFFQAAILLRVYGKSVTDKKISDVMPIAKEVNFVVKKFKVPILAASGKFEMVTVPHDGLDVGMCDDFSAVADYLKSFGDFTKDDKKGWHILGTHYPVISEFKAKLYGDTTFGNQVRQKIINTMLSQGVIEEGSDPDVE